MLPSFPGIHGPRDALAYGVKVAGATLFVVDEGVDTGAIVAQVAVPVEDDDDEESLTERIKVAERAMLVENVGRMAREGFTSTADTVRLGARASEYTLRAHDWRRWVHHRGVTSSASNAWVPSSIDER